MDNLRFNLQKLGFSKNDIVVYLALLEKGPCNAGPIISATNLHRNLVYISINHLLSKKMVTEKTIRGRKIFAITDPKILSEEFKQKAKVAEDVSKQVAEMIPKTVQEITIHQGNEEYLNLLASILKSLPKKSTIYVLGTGGAEFMKYTMIPIWEPYHEVALKRKLKIKMISYESQKKSLIMAEHHGDIYNIRYLNDKNENPGGIHIYPELGIVLNIIYSDARTPVTAIKIKNLSLSKGYLNLFNNLWKTAKK